MKDLLGREIKIGDVVAVAEASHANVDAGVVKGFTKAKVVISSFFTYNEFDDTLKTICTYDKERGSYMRDPRQVVIMNTDGFEMMTNTEYYNMIKKISGN